MMLLVLGLLLFIGIHSVRIFADAWRSEFIKQRGENFYKGVYTVVSLIGLILIIYGYGQTRLNPVMIWQPPLFLTHIASFLILIAFVLLAAAYIPGNRIRAVVGHPMVAGIKIWAFAHLLVNGRLGDIVLFLAFLLWAVASFRAARGRDRRAGISHQLEQVSIARDAITIVVGLLFWFVFALWLHAALIGIHPFAAMGLS